MDNENKNIGGRLAANFRRANIAEGLAIQMFRPFSAISPFPREEDFGIDFIGTLIKTDGRTLVAEDSFVVQIKTVSAPIFTFSGEGIEWLRNLKLPYFPVIADLNKGTISVYSLNRFHMPIFASIVNNYRFVIQNEYNGGDGVDDFPLGDPIMEWSLTDCTHPNFPSWAYNVFSPIVKIEANNFKYGKLWRFESFAVDTFRFNHENPFQNEVVIPTEIMEIPPGDSEVILSTLRAVIGPFANWASNQINNNKKGDSLLKLRESLRELNFDPDTDNNWDEIANGM